VKAPPSPYYNVCPAPPPPAYRQAVLYLWIKLQRWDPSSTWLLDADKGCWSVIARRVLMAIMPDCDLPRHQKQHQIDCSDCMELRCTVACHYCVGRCALLWSLMPPEQGAPAAYMCTCRLCNCKPDPGGCSCLLLLLQGRDWGNLCGPLQRSQLSLL
jgi:hypothetical protein